MYEKLKLGYKSLEPYIDDGTLDLHYNKHYQKYLDNLNRLLKENNYEFGSLYDLVMNIDKINLNDRGEVLFNLGGVINHSLYFYIISDKKNNIPYAIDLTNNNTDYLRNKFRHKVLPIYKEINKDAHLKFLQFSNILNKYDNFINSYIDKIYPSIVNDEINIPLLLKEDELIIDNIIYKYLVNISDNINTRHIEFVKKVISSSKKNVIINLPGITLERKYNKLVIFEEKGNYLYELNDYVKLNNGYVIKKINDTLDNSNYVCKLDSKEIKFPLYVRNFNIGDRIDIKNSYNKKVSDIFIDSKISDRKSFPIVLDSLGNILWLPGVKKSKFCKTKEEKYDIILLYCLEEEYEK